MPSLQIPDNNISKVTKETTANHGKLSIKAAIKGVHEEKPRLYKKVQNILSSVKTSLAEDIVEARND